MCAERSLKPYPCGMHCVNRVCIPLTWHLLLVLPIRSSWPCWRTVLEQKQLRALVVNVKWASCAMCTRYNTKPGGCYGLFHVLISYIFIIIAGTAPFSFPKDTGTAHVRTWYMIFIHKTSYKAVQHLACVVVVAVLCVWGSISKWVLGATWCALTNTSLESTQNKQRVMQVGKQSLHLSGQFAGQSPGAHWPGLDPALWVGGSLQAREEASTA